MDQSVKSPALRAVEDAFERMFELTRSRPAPTLAERLDRLARLRAAVSENEARFEQAISADFGHRSQIETAIAETLLVLGEIKHPDVRRAVDPKTVVRDEPPIGRPVGGHDESADVQQLRVLPGSAHEPLTQRRGTLP